MKKYIAMILVCLVALCLAAPLLVAAETVGATPADTCQAVTLEPTQAPAVVTATEQAQETDPGGIDGFLDWNILATYAGAMAFVLAVTQFTKGISLFDKLPTQVWSWIVAMIGMYPAYYFTGQLTPGTAVMVPINAVLVALAANGSFQGLSRLFKTT